MSVSRFYRTELRSFSFWLLELLAVHEVVCCYRNDYFSMMEFGLNLRICSKNEDLSN